MAKIVTIGPYSAYAIAVENGYQGTEQEWLASLVGPQGAQGASVTGAQIEENGHLILTVHDPKTGTDTTIDAGSIDTTGAVQNVLQQIQQAGQAAVDAVAQSMQQAESSANAAAASAGKAANSASQAAASQSAAAGSAIEAAGSATAASSSAQNAAQSAEDAKSWTPGFAVDSIWAARLNGENTSDIFQQYAAALAAQGVTVGDILRRWFTLLWDDNTYGAKFYKFDASATPDGELIQSSAALGAAKPGTNTTEAQDPYFSHGAFWAVEVAYEIEDKEVAIKAVAGVNGVTRAALLSGQYGMVGVAQKTGWYADTEDDSYYYHYYRAAPANFVTDANAYKPLPEGVALDGSVRPYVVHAKYMAGRGADGKLTSASGLAAVNFISMQSQATEWRKRGADYCGICGCDLSFRMRMFWMKYGKKGNSGTLEGCSNYNYQRIAKVSETGVKRVLLTASDASGYLVGSTVSVGDKGTGTSTDRGVASMRALADKVRILSIEDVQVNGTSYKALNLDTPAAFNTVAGETYISTMPWHSGSCDNVKGADGSPTSCTSGKEPFVLQLLECQPGGYAISADQLTEQVLTADAYTHRLVCFRQAAQIATSITSNAVRSPVMLTMPTSQTAAWLYQKDVEIDADGNMYAVAAGSPAGSTTGSRAAVSVPAAGSRVYAWWAWANLSHWGSCGLSCGHATFSCGTASWSGLAGACGSGSNRGEYAG